jgi:hypothetical protein
MKFMAKTDMLSATLRDLSLAGLQHSLVEYVPLEGYNAITGSNGNRKRSARLTAAFFVFSAGVLAYGAFLFDRVRKEIKNIPEFLKEPLSGAQGVFT